MGTTISFLLGCLVGLLILSTLHEIRETLHHYKEYKKAERDYYRQKAKYEKESN